MMKSWEGSLVPMERASLKVHTRLTSQCWVPTQIHLLAMVLDFSVPVQFIIFECVFGK